MADTRQMVESICDSVERLEARVDGLSRRRADAEKPRSKEDLLRELMQVSNKLETAEGYAKKTLASYQRKLYAQYMKSIEKEKLIKADATRMFPSYTLDDLKRMVKNPSTPEKGEQMRQEIAAREAGTSKPRVTPQVGWGRSDATGHHVKTIKAHSSQGGHDIVAHATQYGVGDWRWGVKGSPYSAETSKSGDAPNKGEAFRRAKAELSAMMRSAQYGAESLRDGFLPGSDGYQKHEKVAAFYRKQV